MHISGISLQDMIHSLRQSIAIVDSEGIITSVNHAWIKGAQEEGVPQSFCWIGVNYLQIFDAILEEDEQKRNLLQAVLHGDASFYHDEFQSGRQHAGRWFHLEASPLKQADLSGIHGMVICLYDISKSKRLEHELMEALSHVRTLRGLLPICAVCKRIRDDDDIWNSIESFLQKHTHAEFTHDICPDCIRRLYPKYSSILDSPPYS